MKIRGLKGVGLTRGKGKRERERGRERERRKGGNTAKIAAICIIYRVPAFGLLAAIYSVRKSIRTAGNGRSEGSSSRRGGNNTFSSRFTRSRGTGVTKGTGPCPRRCFLLPRPGVHLRAFSNIMKSVTCKKFKIQPSFPRYCPATFLPSRTALRFPLYFASAREGNERKTCSIFSSVMNRDLEIPIGGDASRGF